MSEQLNLNLAVEPAAALPQTPPPPRRPAQQRRTTAETITRADELLTLAATDTELSELLAGFGYDAQQLQAGRVLQTAAHEAYLARQQAIAAVQLADANAFNAVVDARRTLSDYRQVARTLFKTSSERTALALKGYLPRDLQELIQVARTGYQAALGSPTVMEALTRSGYSAAKLQAALEGLDAVIAAHNAQAAARASAAHATYRRRAALSALQSWLTQFCAVARVASRQRPELAARIAS